uniref:GB1/RHD3-type G domain-containing protein n=1 Tax=Varanus komodoensis TaxID=61221 RepID=A0A8D2J786_VARKO
MVLKPICMDAPVCLIENRPDGKFVINEEAAELLASISQPVVVVAIVGLYRTGKSYLMNKLAGKTSGFALGSMLQACTKGIWMWCIPHPEKPDQTLVLLDTEGLGDVAKGDSTNDTWIFALTLLLSSTLVYNSKGTIDQPALNELHYVTELTECIKAKAPSMDGLEDSAEFVRFFPDFIWSLRDFTLCLELDGQPITADDYLEHALTLKRGATAEKALLRVLTLLISFTEGSRRRASVADLKGREGIYGCRHSFRYPGPKPFRLVLFPVVLANLAKTYVDTIQNGRVPCLENAVLALAKIENPAAVAEATARYVELMEQWLNLPTETLEELLEIHAGCEEEALRVFRARAFKDDTHEFQAQLKVGEYRKNNELESSKCCEAVLSSVCQELEEGIRNAIYAQPGGHKHFLEDLNKLEQRYRQEPNKGVMAEAILQQYFKDKEQIGTTILQCDKILTQEEQEKAGKGLPQQALRVDVGAAVLALATLG